MSEIPSEATLQFACEHLNDDTSRLLLSAHRYPGVDVPSAVEQIEARRRLRTKLPEWYALDRLVMGGRIPAEQCSSEQTARFKRRVMLSDARSLCDMTGGMGVDFWYMSEGLDWAVYNERQSFLCEAARHNFQLLSASRSGCSTRYEFREGLSTEMPVPDVDVIYLDPARRASDGARVYEVSDCEPDVVAWQDELLSHCRQLLVKVSPMADISRTVSRLKHVSDVYVIAVRNECKELLLSMRPEAPIDAIDYGVHCIDFFPGQRTLEFHFRSRDAVGSVPAWTTSLDNYFYEPDVTIIKAQGYAALAAAFDVQKLSADCHYFTSAVPLPDFPGRAFVIDEVIPFSSRMLKHLRASIPQANIATRCFPLTADQLRQRTGIRDGGEVYLFGATLHEAGPILARCHKC